MKRIILLSTCVFLMFSCATEYRHYTRTNSGSLFGMKKGSEILAHNLKHSYYQFIESNSYTQQQSAIILNANSKLFDEDPNYRKIFQILEDELMETTLYSLVQRIDVSGFHSIGMDENNYILNQEQMELIAEQHKADILVIIYAEKGNYDYFSSSYKTYNLEAKAIEVDSNKICGSSTITISQLLQ